MAFLNRIPIESFKIRNSSAVNLGKNASPPSTGRGGGGSSIAKVPVDVPLARVYFFGLLV